MHRIALAAAFVLAAQSAFAGGNTAFVSTLGTDQSNDCLSSSNPCATISHAAAGSPSTDTIRIASGTYQGDSTVLLDPGNISILGSYDQTFTTQDYSQPSVLTSKGIRPLTVTYDGGGGNLTIRGVSVVKSSSIPTADPSTDSGGGILVRAINAAGVTVSLENVIMEANRAVSGGALAVLAEGGAVVTLDIANSRFSKNKAYSCGAVVIDGIDAVPPIVTITKTLFEKNKAAESGGAVCTSVTDPTSSALRQRLDRVTFLKNKATIGAGLFIFVIEGGEMDVEMFNSVFLKNKAFVGAAVTALALPSATVGADIEIDSVNNTITANKAKGGGGGLLLQSVASVELPVSTDASVMMASTNDIVFGNKGLDALVGAEAGTVAILGRDHSIYGDSVAEAPATIVDGDGMQTADPLFVKKGKDVHLLPASPAIDAAACAEAPPTDFEDQMRPAGSGCDIGADEFVP
ncbi:MAG TPA: choice-of-anchor Q domain-containing protein [Candidatus Binatia bacterium]|nr:choice-of-anchor Q domain-containing protein [Candidatus Binatia bacterium]